MVDNKGRKRVQGCHENGPGFFSIDAGGEKVADANAGDISRTKRES